MTHVAIPLWRYAKRVSYRECAFFGIVHPDNPNYACSALWTGAQREMISWALAEAQEELEAELHYFLRPDWVTSESHPWGTKLLTQWGMLISGGVEGNTLVGDSVALNYASDPATLTMVQGALDPADLRLFHEDTTIEVYPTGYILSGGNIVWSIPWCRLVAPAYEDTDEAGLDYADVATWGADKLDVREIVNDPSTQAVLRWQRDCACSGTACEDTTKTGCIHVLQPRIGAASVRQASFSAGVWSPLDCSCCKPQSVDLNYYSGVQQLSHQAEDALLRLAHSKMPEEPCGCDITQRLWKRDRNVPAVLTRERVNCPFGMSDGAWIAWRFANAPGMKLVRSRGNI